jgi:hypothetical protein
MGDHRTNPKAVAKARRKPARMVPAFDMGDGYGFLGFQIEPRWEGGQLAACVIAVGQRISEKGDISPRVKVPIGIIGEITVADFKGCIDGTVGVVAEPDFEAPAEASEEKAA